VTASRRSTRLQDLGLQNFLTHSSPDVEALGEVARMRAAHGAVSAA